MTKDVGETEAESPGMSAVEARLKKTLPFERFLGSFNRLKHRLGIGNTYEDSRGAASALAEIMSSTLDPKKVVLTQGCEMLEALLHLHRRDMHAAVLQQAIYAELNDATFQTLKDLLIPPKKGWRSVVVLIEPRTGGKRLLSGEADSFLYVSAPIDARTSKVRRDIAIHRDMPDGTTLIALYVDYVPK
jgi:hypothetical protein